MTTALANIVIWQNTPLKLKEGVRVTDLEIGGYCMVWGYLPVF